MLLRGRVLPKTGAIGAGRAGCWFLWEGICTPGTREPLRVLCGPSPGPCRLAWDGLFEGFSAFCFDVVSADYGWLLWLRVMCSGFKVVIVLVDGSALVSGRTPCTEVWSSLRPYSALTLVCRTVTGPGLPTAALASFDIV